MNNTEGVKRTFTCVGSNLMEVPVWESHHRGRNWMAMIRLDASAPNGLGREWLPRGRGDIFYTIADLRKMTAVEFGADYYSGTGTKYSKRYYGVVVEITPTGVVLEEFDTAALACVVASTRMILAVEEYNKKQALLRAEWEREDAAKKEAMKEAKRLRAEKRAMKQAEVKP